MKQTRKMTQISMFLALAIVLQIVESMIPLPLLIPGVKLGFAQVVGLIVLKKYGSKEMFTVNILRVIMVGLLRVGFGLTFMIALSGTILASIMMAILDQTDRFTIYGISLGGASMHMVGQVLMVSIVYKQWALLVTYLPVLLIVSIATGLFTGIVAEVTLRRLKRF